MGEPSAGAEGGWRDQGHPGLWRKTIPKRNKHTNKSSGNISNFKLANLVFSKSSSLLEEMRFLPVSAVVSAIVLDVIIDFAVETEPQVKSVCLFLLFLCKSHAEFMFLA